MILPKDFLFENWEEDNPAVTSTVISGVYAHTSTNRHARRHIRRYTRRQRAALEYV